MRIISLNANGIRAAARKGFFDWMARQEADVLPVPYFHVVFTLPHALGGLARDRLLLCDRFADPAPGIGAQARCERGAVERVRQQRVADAGIVQ